MKQQFTHRSDGNTALLLLFTGWGMDAAQLGHVRLAGHDTMVVWDYRTPDFDAADLAGYADIYLFAWSMGVYAADEALAALSHLPITLKVAVNGTLTPVDDECGIPESIYRGTRDGLCPRTLMKFYRRMCASVGEWKWFQTVLPKRDIAELRDELDALAVRSGERRGCTDLQHLQWDRVVVADSDRIFPTSSMLRAWKAHPRVRTVSSGHLPDMQRIVEQEVIDKQLVASRFRRAFSSYDDQAVVQRHMADLLWRRWEGLLSSDSIPRVILEAGYGTGMLTSLYAPAIHPDRLVLCDLVEHEVDASWKAEIVVGDAEMFLRSLPDESVDAVVSSATVQWFDSLERWLVHVARVLTPGGCAVISTFGPDNLCELASVTRMPLRYYGLEEIRDMVPSGMKLEWIDEERVTLTFDSPSQALRHLKDTGVDAMRHAAPSVHRIIGSYPLDDNGHAPLTYHPVYFILRKDAVD